MAKNSSQEGPDMEELCRHIHEASYNGEVAVVFGFSWLVEETMNGNGKGIRKNNFKVDFVEM